MITSIALVAGGFVAGGVAAVGAIVMWVRKGYTPRPKN